MEITVTLTFAGVGLSQIQELLGLLPDADDVATAVTSDVDNASSVTSLTTSSTPSADRHGLPWDGRIHASSKVMNADGSWRQRRNVAPAIVEQVEAELRGLKRGQTAAPVVPVPPVPPVPTLPPDIAGALAGATQAWIPGMTPATADTPAALIQSVTGAINAGTLTPLVLQAVCAEVGLPNLPAIVGRPDLVPALRARLGL